MKIYNNLVHCLDVYMKSLRFDNWHIVVCFFVVMRFKTTKTNNIYFISKSVIENQEIINLKNTVFLSKQGRF